jgi:hypothetical protein
VFINISSQAEPVFLNESAILDFSDQGAAFREAVAYPPGFWKRGSSARGNPATE